MNCYASISETSPFPNRYPCTVEVTAVGRDTAKHSYHTQKTPRHGMIAQSNISNSQKFTVPTLHKLHF
jgi:hypothetical protein